MVLPVKKLHSEAKLPNYAHASDAGMDLYALETTALQPHERRLISTGIALAIPYGCVGLIWDKSGLAAKHGVKTLAGVIDAGYRGEIRVVLHNLSAQSFLIEKGSKIAQMLIQPVVHTEIIEVEELEETPRGELGFGSTGMH